MRPGARLSVTLAMLGASMSATAVDYQVHGYAAQGFVYTDDNNFFGKSSDGSFHYYEAGLNASVQVNPKLLFAAQGAIRDAGISDDGALRLDYAVADYRFLEEVDTTVGVRAGKVKNPLGFYNDTRDVVFTRPSILLPVGYSDNQNQRSLVFTAPGAQVYGTRLWGRHELSFTATQGFDHNVRRSDERLLLNLQAGGQPLPFDLHIEDSWNAQVMDSIDGGRWQFAVSRFFGRFDLRTAPTVQIAGKFDVTITLFSARFNAEKFSITAEYGLAPNKNRVTLGGIEALRTSVTADGGYLQGEYRINPQWGAFARVEANYLDRSDRSGREYVAANPGTDRASRSYRSIVAGASWRYGEHWGIWGEYHWIDGTVLLQKLQNPQPLVDHWSLIMLMVGFKF
jgi:hypothetical protein